MENYGLTTQLVHSERRQGIENGAVHKPIYTSSQYTYDDANDLVAVFQGRPGFSYARQGTPTTGALEKTIDQMEGGAGTCSFATGMAALTAVFYTLLKAGDHLISSQFIFGNTNSLLINLARLGVEVTHVDGRDIEQVKAAIRPTTRMVFMETIANPGTQIVDLAAIGDLCEEHKLLYVLDNTMTTPHLLKGKEVKAGLVMNSLSKMICGHANALGGAITNTGLFDWAEYLNIYDDYKSGDSKNWGLLQVRKKGLRDMGATLSADAAQRIAIGAETFEMRMERGCSNALALARFLEQHPGVVSVSYPGLESHPEHERAKSLFGNRGFGSLLAFELQPDIDCIDFLNRLNVVLLATHLGDTRTLSLPVAKTIYHEMGPIKRKEMGIADGLLRVSLGIENERDLISDFAQALNYYR
ncbi:MAG: cystathionine gamma-synthase family protein [Alcaligenaceae bacterium]|nr:cystathionine gamma-synthase family protein [Alcaligenaceae bacterium]